MLKVCAPRVMGMVNPLGISESRPKFSWQIESNQNDTMQCAFQLLVSRTEDGLSEGRSDFYDSGRVETGDNMFRAGRAFFVSGERCYWTVRVWDNHGQVSDWCRPQWFEMGLLHQEDWQARWIEPEQRPLTQFLPDNLQTLLQTPALHEPAPEAELEPCPIIRRAFTLKRAIRRARLYATAHGVYQASINGARVGDLEMMPEATPYFKMLQVQTYDVTALLQPGENALGMILGDGWWRGHVSCYGNPCVYGTVLASLWQLNVEYEDGSSEIIGSDEHCRSYRGELCYSDIGIGEKIDMRLHVPGWNLPGKPFGTWSPVQVRDYGYENLCGQNAEPARVVRTLKPVSAKTCADGSVLIDFGQIIAGNCRILFDGTGRRGEQIQLSYCEQVDKNGEFIYNFAGYRQHEDWFILAGTERECYEPKFTWRGFRWLRVKGYSGQLALDAVEARLIASDLQQTCKLECSDPRITKLHDMIQWTLINNLLSIPTDNPDRERAGWTGDFEMIAATLCYHYNVEQFSSRFFQENRLEQHENGCMPMVVPMHMLRDNGSSAGWGDEVIIAPWEAYMAYGDRQILSDNYEMMQRWMDYVVRRMELEPQLDDTVGEGIVANAVDMSAFQNWGPDMPENVREHFRYIWDADFQFGDWMVPSGNFDDDGNWTYLSRHNCESFVPCFYTAYTTELMAKIAAELGKTADAAYYAELNRKIREAVIAELYDTGYIPENEFQGILTLALKAKLYPEGKRSVLDKRLQDVIYRRDEGRINTGFTSMEHILFELVKGGHPETAYDLLFNERIPSFLYMIDHGATGIWETWRNIEEDGTVNTASYTQYAIGNVGKWLMAGIGGIYALEPGYRRIGIAPVIDPKRRITSASAQYETPNGLAATEWSVCGSTVHLKVQIPANTTAEIRFIGSDRPPLTVGSGTHQLEYTLN